MRQMGGKAAVRAVLATSLFAACLACSPSSADKAGPTATVATEAPTTATTNPYAVPPVIDAAYVNRVLAGLDAITGDAVRLVYHGRSIPTEALDRLRAVYANQSVLQFIIDGLQLDVSSGFKNYRHDVGNRLSMVSQLITLRPDCIFAQVQRDFSAISTDTSAVVNPQWVALTPLDPARDSQGYNPTLWSLTYDGFTRDRTAPQNPCAR